ncbi:MAG TPA: hypothetical protein VIL87_11210 [Dermatophilaceae bacterium]|jgi:hypothetical protein
MRQKVIGATSLPVLGLMVAGVAPATAAPAPSPQTQTADGIKVDASTGVKTSAELDAFILSDTPKTIQVERATGKIVSVIAASAVAPSIVQSNVCNVGSACLSPS